MSDIADKIYAATGLTLNAEAAAKIGQMIQAENARLREALGELLRCTEKHVFGDECKAQRDNARAALGETQ
jgi:hypothetical protein